MPSRATKLVVRILLALLFIVAGVLHFTHTDAYLAIMPPYLPHHRTLVLLSGIGEIGGGAALLVPRLKRGAACFLIALLIAVFPANIHMAVNNVSIGETTFPTLLLWLRLPLQFVLIALIWWCARGDAREDDGRHTPRV